MDSLRTKYTNAMRIKIFRVIADYVLESSTLRTINTSINVA